MNILVAIGKFIGAWLLEKGGAALVTYIKEWIELQAYKKKIKVKIKDIMTNEKDPVKRAQRIADLLNS